MSYTLPLTAEELERRLLKISDLALSPVALDGTKIRVALEHFIEDGSGIKFKAPVNCSAVTTLVVQSPTGEEEFSFADANGNDIGVLDNLFSEGAIVNVLLDLDTKAAFVQNADTNKYLEDRFEELSTEITTQIANVLNDIPDISGLATEGYVDTKISEIDIPDTTGLAPAEHEHSYLYYKKNVIRIPNSGNLQLVAYDGGKFVALSSDGNTGAYSEDGINWVESVMPFNSRWCSVAYGDGKFVAIAGGGSSELNKAAYSEDGVTWTEISLPYSTFWNSVTYGNGRFVAVATTFSYKAAYSEDGKNWVGIDLPSTANWRSVAYGSGKFVITPSGSTIAIYSEDGVNWIDVNLCGYVSGGRNVIYVNGKFILPAYSDSFFYSDDGIAWNSVILPVSGNLASLAYGNGKFVALVSNSDLSLYSEDFITWNQIVLPVSTSWCSITYGNGKFVAVATSNMVAYSEDGIKWKDGFEEFIQDGSAVPIITESYVDTKISEIDIPDTNGLATESYVDTKISEIDIPDTSGLATESYVDTKISGLAPAEHEHPYLQYLSGVVTLPIAKYWYSSAAGDGKFVVLGMDGTVAYSADGLNWGKSVAVSTGGSFIEVAYGNGKFVVVGYNSNKAAYSSDGINWVATTMPRVAYWRSIAYGNGKFVAVAEMESNLAAVSDDGITWTEITMPSSARWMAVSYGNGKFVAVSTDSGKTAVSDDGLTWSEHWVGSGVLADSCVIHGNDKFIAIGGSEYVARTSIVYSTDGINWIQSTLPSSEKWISLSYGDGKFVAIAYKSNKAAYSNDGINWISTDLPISDDWFTVSYSNGKFVAVVRNSKNVALSTDGITWFTGYNYVVQDGTIVTPEQLGFKEVSLTGYATKEYVDTTVADFTESDPTVPAHVKNITANDITNWNNKSTFNGDYNSLTNKPTIPSIDNIPAITIAEIDEICGASIYAASEVAV